MSVPYRNFCVERTVRCNTIPNFELSPINRLSQRKLYFRDKCCVLISVTVTGNFAVGIFAMRNFAVGYISLRKSGRKEVLP